MSGPRLQPWIIHCASPGTTSVPLRNTRRRDVLVTSAPGGTYLSRPLSDVGSSIGLRRGLKSLAESGAKAPHSTSQSDLLVRSASPTLDYPLRFIGHDKRTPPKYAWEGPACHVYFRGNLPVRSAPGGTCLSRPPSDVGSSICLRRGLKSLAESGAKAPHSTSRRDLLVRSISQREIMHCVSPGTRSLSVRVHRTPGKTPLQQRQAPFEPWDW